MRRQAATLVALAVATVATVATSQASPRVDTTFKSVTIRLDAAHGMASQLFVLSVPAGAELDGWTARFVVDGVSASDSNGRPVVADEAVRLRILAVSAEAEIGITPAATTRYGQAAGSGPWALSAGSYSYVDLPVDCQSAGPCERGFRLLALLTSSASKAEVSWHLESNLSWWSTAYPSGVAPSLRIDNPVLVEGPGPQLDVGTSPEHVTLAADHPVVVRVVQLRFEPAPGDPNSVPGATVEAVAVADTPSSRSPSKAVTSIFLIPNPPDDPASQPPLAASSATLLQKDADPFSGCVPGRECVRTFLVTMNWTYGGERAYVWQLIVHRTDLDHVLAEPANTVTLRPLGGIEPLAGPPSHLHFEGDTTYGPGEGQQPDLPLRVRLVPGTASEGAGSGLSARQYANLLPIPGSLRYAVNFVGQPPLHTDLFITVRNVTGTGPGGEATGNPFVGCKADTNCPTLTFEGSIDYPSNLSPERVSVHWSLDVYVYSYPGLEFVVEAAPSAPGSSTSPLVPPSG